MSLHPSSIKFIVSIYIALFMVAMGYAISFIPFAGEKVEAQTAYQPDTDTAEIEISVPSSRRFLKPPDFVSQKAIGYESGRTFAVPNGMEFRVNFWKKIYSQYTADQIVIHDNNSMIIYAIVDVSDINKQSGVGQRERQRLKNRRINYVKNKYSEILKNIHTNINNASSFSGEDLRIYNEFKRISAKNKFLNASYIKNIRAQVGQKDIFIRGIYYAGEYLKQMEEIFAAEEIPMELTRIPFVESSFNLRARSKVGASGIWQFIRTTGKLFLKIDSSVDERNDPIKATHAAAKLLKQNYKMLQSWPLAVTAYNHGPQGMITAVKRSGTKDIVWITNKYESRTFGFASRNFYAEFLAALEVQTNYSEYFGQVEIADKIEFDSVKIPSNVSISTIEKYARVDREMLMPLNPALLRVVWTGQRYIPEGYELRIPKGSKNRFMARLRSAPTVSPGAAQYKVREGDTLVGIATRHRTTINKIVEANQIDGSKIQVGQILVIP